MPKAAVHVDRDPFSGEDHVDAPPSVSKHGTIDAEAKAGAMQLRAERELGGRVPSTGRTHAQADRRIGRRRPLRDAASS